MLVSGKWQLSKGAVKTVLFERLCWNQLPVKTSQNLLEAVKMYFENSTIESIVALWPSTRLYTQTNVKYCLFAYVLIRSIVQFVQVRLSYVFSSIIVYCFESYSCRYVIPNNFNSYNSKSKQTVFRKHVLVLI